MEEEEEGGGCMREAIEGCRGGGRQSWSAGAEEKNLNKIDGREEGAKRSGQFAAWRGLNFSSGFRRCPSGRCSAPI